MSELLRDTEFEFSAINRWMSEAWRAAVAQRVLAWWENASEDVKRPFKSVVSKNVTVNGFRNSLDAPTPLLQKEILRIMQYSPIFVGLVLQIWIESHEVLKDIVFNHLTKSKMPTEGVDFSEYRFRGNWKSESWTRERDKIVSSHSEFCEDDVALMLCCVSGSMPDAEGDEIEEPAGTHEEGLFQQWLGTLREMPADAPEWEGANDFVAAVSELIQAKEDEHNQIVRLKGTLAELKKEFGRELAFFQCDTDSWFLEHLRGQLPASRTAAPGGMAELLRLTERLRALLTDYRPVYDIAPVIQEEVELGPKRTDIQVQTLKCISRIVQLLSGNQAADADKTQPSEGGMPPDPGAASAASEQEDGAVQGIGPEQNGPPLPAEAQIEQAESGVAPAGETAPLAELAGEDDEIDDDQRPTKPCRAEGDGETVVDDESVVSVGTYISLETENLTLRQEFDTLQNELQTSQEIVRLWRVAYETARKELAQTGKAVSDDEFLPIKDVRTAVAVAREKFADELMFQPNSKSEIEDNPYEKPREVWAALEWLATTYRRSKVGEVKIPRFSPSILKACGWRYTGNQSQLTMSNYEPWYTTSLDGKIYWLKAHIGTGSNKDARYTIRIAFDWDRERQVVVIGYIGQHQQTSAT